MASDASSTSSVARVARVPKCYFCFSTDSMVPFQKSPRVFMLSWLMPVRWRYCRKCARHFITAGKPRNI